MRDINQATDVSKKQSRCDPKQVYLVPTSQKGWAETMEEPVSLCAPTPCSASLSPHLDCGFPGMASRVQVASKPHQGLQAVNETREDARREVSTARGLGLHKTNLACAGEEQDLSGWCGAHAALTHHEVGSVVCDGFGSSWLRGMMCLAQLSGCTRGSQGRGNSFPSCYICWLKKSSPKITKGHLSPSWMLLHLFLHISP